MLNKKRLVDIDVNGKRVLVRVDFNVPVSEGKIADDTRLRMSLPTIRYLLEHNAAVILCSHFGRPKTPFDKEYSLKPVAEHLAGLLGQQVHFVDECVGPKAEAAARALKPGEVLVLENTRFCEGETKNDPKMAQQLAALAEVYVNDAFGSAHRAHASTEGVAHFLPAVAGFLMEKEIEYLGNAIAHPQRPFIAILGGAKVGDKIGVITNLLERADRILIGGGMANTFFLAQGIPMGDSLVEEEAVPTAQQLLERAAQRLRLPVDLVIAERFDAHAESKVIPVGPIPTGWRVMDIGPKTVRTYGEEVRHAKTVVWNGPMGVFEFPAFAQGTFGIAKAIAQSQAISIVGGGDSVSAINQSGLSDRITHISTGGGASLEMLEGKVLPGLEALDARD